MNTSTASSQSKLLTKADLVALIYIFNVRTIETYFASVFELTTECKGVVKGVAKGEAAVFSSYRWPEYFSEVTATPQ